jgi:hypothetical protein
VNRRLLGSAAAILLLGGPVLLLGSFAWSAVPRESCRWGDSDFCSDYGSFYRALAGLFALALMLALWAINRKRRGS